MLDVNFTVQSFSVEEDWITGISYVPFTYSAPYAGKTPYFPPDLPMYVASKDSDSRQPYRTIPWRAVFSGCCNQFVTSTGNTTFSFEAQVDLSNAIASVRIVTLPQLWLTPGLPTRVLLCATPLAGRSSLLQISHGTLNYAKDDNAPATLDWDVVDGPSGTTFQAPDTSPNASPLCRTLVIGVLNGLHDYLTIRCAIGTGCLEGASTGCAIASHVVALHAAPQTTPPAAVIGNALGCASGAECYLLVSAGDELSQSQQYGSVNLSLVYGAASGLPYTQPLEVRYKVSMSGMYVPTGLLATSPAPHAEGRVTFAPPNVAEVGVPAGWTPWHLGPVEGTCRASTSTCHYITDMEVRG